MQRAITEWNESHAATHSKKSLGFVPATGAKPAKMSASLDESQLVNMPPCDIPVMYTRERSMHASSMVCIVRSRMKPTSSLHPHQLHVVDAFWHVALAVNHAPQPAFSSAAFAGQFVRLQPRKRKVLQAGHSEQISHCQTV